MDLLRLHFFFVWPVLFCFGLFFGFQIYSGFSFALVLQAVLIGFFGFEAGLILNDIVDANLDKKEIEFKGLTKYWRPFGKRPISQGLISQRNAIALFAVFVAVTSVLIFTLPFPNAIYVFSLMLICYCLEAFYQIKKRHDKFSCCAISWTRRFCIVSCRWLSMRGQFELACFAFVSLLLSFGARSFRR